MNLGELLVGELLVKAIVFIIVIFLLVLIIRFLILVPMHLQEISESLNEFNEDNNS